MTPDPTEQIDEYVRNHPDADPVEVLGTLGLSPEYHDHVEDALAGDGERADHADDPPGARSVNQHSEGEDGGVLVNGESAENPATEPDSPRSNPTPDADASASTAPPSGDTDTDAVLEAFDAAVRWFHEQLDRDLPDDAPHDTPRDYYRDGRGWTDATIDAKRLGYAPEDTRDGLLARLHREGFDRDTILATGLFGERDDGSLYATWTGRYVLPYLDADGRAVFAITRRLEPPHPADWAGKYGDDDDPAKYHKLPVSRDGVLLEEPMYGLDTVDAGKPVVITEGIADAITAHQAGYPCVSPVTTTFKTSDREALADVLTERGVPRVYIVQDAERLGSDLDDRDRLTLPQYGEGLKGAVATAEFLADHGLDARVGELPRPGLDKVDLDDYLTAWDGDLRPVLASARPVEDHPAHDPREAALDAADRTRPDRRDDADAPEGTAAGSALFDLGITDVTPPGVAAGYRGKSPLGHHGESEDYFVLLEGRGLAYDHKHKAAYNALTYLLVDAGERRPDRPNGPVDDDELLAAWVHAKGASHISDDDPIPRPALRAVARDATEWDGDLVEQTTRDGDTFDGLPTDAYNDALAHVRGEYGLDPGRSRVSTVDPDAEPVAPFALAALDLLAGDERERVMRKRGLEPPTTDEAREDLRDALFRELRAGRYTVLDAPTALGKTDTVATEPWRRRADVTGEAPVVQFHETTDARDQAADRTEQTTGGGAVLRGRKEASPLARGDHDPPEDPDDPDAPDVVVTVAGEPVSEWLDRMCERKGLPFSTALALAREHNDQGLDDLPPQGEEDPAVAQWNGLPRDDDGEPAADVIHATHQFAHVPTLRQYTNAIFDERPDFTVEFTESGDPDAETARVRRMVGAYLREIDAPVSTWEDLVALAQHNAPRGDAARERDAVDDALGTDPPTDWYVNNPDAHALAPAVARAVWNALRWEDLDATGRRSTTVVHEPPRFDTDGDQYAREYVTVVLDDTHTVRRVRSTPDFSQARAVVGLDAHPCMDLWRLNTHPDMTRDAVLDPTERRLWRRYERGLTVVQIGDAARPRSGPNARRWMNDDRVGTVLDRLRDHYGDDLQTAIAPDAVERDVRRLLEDAGADLPGDGFDTAEEHTMHYGEEKSRNDFAGERAGFVYGCVDPGDGYVLDTLAELGLDAEPERVAPDAVDDPDHADCPACDGAGCRDCHDTGRKRAKGRGFDGPDADTADAVLASVRENHVAQAAGRYARNPDDPESGAVVFAHTDATPPGFADLQVPGVEWLATALQREIIDELASRPSATAREIADAVDCSKDHVRDTLARLEKEGLVRRRRGAGDHGADVYREDGADGALVDLGLDTVETTDGPLRDTSRWSAPIWDLHADESALGTPPDAEQAGPTPADGADRPPDPPD